ncbi:transposon Tf2-1 polyprotein isoform X1 [Cucumis melo var. makuwa]|uniref:Transposon Tf2-1 polyprotein isoform X1 n=1 Tax=Cucumis melo var. makuwa TaxID=1194695 RepID=A0A5D3CTT4_CUCMM|nr:transposon Tf2-1 polyprotein isoform X1 [Cucumis melo var. makuwa]
MRDRARPVYERELMAVLLSVQRWRPYLLGAKFIVKTDQKSLKFLLEQRVIQPQYQKWVSKLLGYSFEVVYKPGLENKAADALSRKPPDIQLNAISAPYLVDLQVIKEEVKKDEKLKKVIANLSEEGEAQANKFTLKNGHLHYKNRLFSPITSRAVNTPEIPHQVWSDISIDFIDGLPKAKGCDVILVVVDRLSKYSHFLALKHPYTAKSVADIFVKEIVRLHGFPSSIVSDRDKIFLSHFWNELFKMAGTKLRRSIAYHLQSDGQTEVVNRGLETYLRCFCSERPREWILWLPWDEYWYNTTYQKALDMSPFQVVYGRKPPTLLSYGERKTSDSSVDEQLRERDVALDALREHLLNEKLSSRYFGPYKILERIGEVAYRLELPADAVIHPVFHVSQLRKFASNQTNVLPTLQHVTEKLEWQSQSEKVRDYGLDKSGKWEVLIAWQNLPDYEASWEDYDEIKKLYPNLHLEDKSIERLDIQLEKQQLLLKCIEGIAKDNSTISRIREGSSSRGLTIESIIEGGRTTLKEIKVEGKKGRACIVRGENTEEGMYS